MKKRTLCKTLSWTFIAIAGVSTPAVAQDTCWNHNGSVMRLESSGNFRRFVYEEPKRSLGAAGVDVGTVLFEGRKSGNRYRGTARVFSESCPGSPLRYSVSGPVDRSQTRVTLTGRREIYDGCEATGRFRQDRLVFTYAYQC